MAVKANHCCCVGCDRPPVMVPTPAPFPGGPSDGFGNPAPIPAQQFCLSCMPYELCIEAACSTGTLRSMFTRHDPCDAYHTISYWSGFLFVGKTFVTAEIQLQIVYEDCYVVFVCPDLGITGAEPSSQILLTWPLQSALSPHCQDCVDEFYPTAVLSWDLSLSGGIGACMITASPVSNTSLTPAMPCPHCDAEPCAIEDIFYHDELLAYPRFKQCPVCIGCDCVSTYMCITVLADGTPIDGGLVKICNFMWSTGGGTVIRVDSAPDGTCQLELISTPVIYGYGSATPVGPLSIVGMCPNVTATFSYTVTSESDPTKSKSVTVNIASTECGECASLTSVPCCDGPVSRILTATVDGTQCSCGEVAITILEETLTGDTVWKGSSGPADFCGGGVGTPCQVALTLSCSNGYFHLGGDLTSVGGQVGNIGSFGNVPPDSGYDSSCSPMKLTFTVLLEGIGDCKCEPPYLPKCNPVVITITE